MQRIWSTMAAACGVALLTACGGSGEPDAAPPTVDDETAANLVIALLSKTADFGTPGFPPHDILEALPGSEFADPSGTPLSYADSVLLGTVESVTQDQAFVLDGPTDSPVPWDQENADVRTLVVTMTVDRTLCTTKQPGQTASFRFVVYEQSDQAIVRQGLKAMGQFVVFIKQSQQGPAADMAWNHGLFSSVGTKGELVYPAIRPLWGDDFFVGGDTIGELIRSCPV